MLLGFISLLITVGQKPISKICIPKGAANIMFPCKKVDSQEEDDGGDRRKLLWYAGDDVTWRRDLAGPAGGGDDYCSNHVGKSKSGDLL
jgi:mlo protein